MKDSPERVKERRDDILRKLDKRPADLTKSELRKLVVAFRKAHDENQARVIRLSNQIAALKAELEAMRARVTRYAEEAMEARDQRDPEVILGHVEE